MRPLRAHPFVNYLDATPSSRSRETTCCACLLTVKQERECNLDTVGSCPIRLAMQRSGRSKVLNGPRPFEFGAWHKGELCERDC